MRQTRHKPRAANQHEQIRLTEQMTVWPEAASTTTASRPQFCVTATRHYSVTTVIHHAIQGFSGALNVGQAGQLSSSSLSINTNKFLLSLFIFKTALKGKKKSVKL